MGNLISGKSIPRTLLFLHALLLLYSCSGIFSKNAAQMPFMSWQFLLLYGGMLMILFIYAIGWQQVIKRAPLTVAFANKAITVVWSIMWGVLLFGETVSPLSLFGAILVVVGVVIFAFADEEGEGEGSDLIPEGGDA